MSMIIFHSKKNETMLDGSRSVGWMDGRACRIREVSREMTAGDMRPLTAVRWHPFGFLASATVALDAAAADDDGDASSATVVLSSLLSSSSSPSSSFSSSFSSPLLLLLPPPPPHHHHHKHQHHCFVLIIYMPKHSTGGRRASVICLICKQSRSAPFLGEYQSSEPASLDHLHQFRSYIPVSIIRTLR